MTLKKIIIGNWKMNPVTLDEAKAILRPVKRTAQNLRRTSVVVAPPFPFLIPLVLSLRQSKVRFGVQDIFWENEGAHTGAVSAAMAAAAGARYAILGHSERRAIGETDEMIGKKLNLALRAGMTPVLCIGEKEHDGQGNYLADLKGQMRASLGALPRKMLGSIVIAYEPVWAIGRSADMAMKPDELEAMAIFIRKTLADSYGEDGRNVPVLYGGSVSVENAADIVSRGRVDGLLIGRESLVAENFNVILRAIDGA